VGIVPVTDNGKGGFVGQVDRKVDVRGVGKVRVRYTLDIQPGAEEGKVHVHCKDLRVSMKANVLQKKRSEEETTQKTIAFKGVAGRDAKFSVAHYNTARGAKLSVKTTEGGSSAAPEIEVAPTPISVRVPIPVTLTENAGNCLLWCLRKPKLEGTVTMTEGQIILREDTGETEGVPAQ
jgi:hypothetical protein